MSKEAQKDGLGHRPSNDLPELAIDDSGIKTEGIHVTTASAALAAAIEEQKPKLFSRHMMPLWGIMGISYLISTMNGFGMTTSSL